MPYEFETKRLIEFADTDMAGIVHFSNFFRFMEAAEHAFFRSLGFTLHREEPGGAMHGFARVHAECRYDAPLRYQDEVSIHLLVTEKKKTSLSYLFLFHKPEGNNGATGSSVVARGALKVVSVTRGRDNDRISVAPLPHDIASAIEVAPPEVLKRHG